MPVCPPEKLHGDLRGDALDCGVFAGVFPEDKFRLVRAFQRRGEVVGMSGDGVNDAPALRQAEAGVAVANATDVAKAAAAMVLTAPGLGGVLPAIETSRRVFQRIITYTLNMLIKKIEMMALLVIGFLLTRHKPLTPMLMVLILFLNDFLTMSISTDRMGFSLRPNRWKTRGILLCATIAGRVQTGVLTRSFPLGPLCAPPGHEAFANADVCRVDFEFAGGRLYAARTRALLEIAAEPFSGWQFGIGPWRHGGARAGRHPHAGDQAIAPARHHSHRRNLFQLSGLAKSLAVSAAGFALRRGAEFTIASW